MLDLLPDDELWDLLRRAAAMLPLTDVARLQGCNSRFRQVLHARDVATQRLQQQPWAASITSLQQVAVWEGIERIEGNRVTYEGASVEVRESSHPTVEAFGRLLQRFPSIRLQIHAHTGRNAPPTFAPRFTRDRAEEVSEMLVRLYSIPRHRMTARGWGKAVAVHNNWPAGRDSARAELFVEVDGLTLPPLPAHYEGVDAATPDESDNEEDGGGLQGMSAAHLQLLVQMLQANQGHGGASAGPFHDDASDDDDEEEDMDSEEGGEDEDGEFVDLGPGDDEEDSARSEVEVEESG